jgi:RimJ/RimL family protein N-acetyltransferase
MPSTPEISITLDDGTPILLRPIAAADRRYIKQAWAHLSEQSRYLRFFAPIRNLSDDQLDYLTDLDQHDHVAWGALHPEGEGLAGIGVGRFIRIPDEPQTAEVAITVVDAYQQRGVGRVLFALLYLRAMEENVTTLRAFLLQENQPLTRRLQALGGQLGHDHGTSTVNLPVYRDVDALPKTPQSRAFRKLLIQLRETLK